MEDFLQAITGSVRLPRMARVRQQFQRPRIEDVGRAVRDELARPDIAGTLRPGARIAITAGSRGIDNIALVLRTVVEAVRERGGEPFLFPAMGSHGGATAAGQREILESFGITPEAMGAPIHCGVEVAELGRLDDGTPVCIDSFAAGADGIILVNRIKPHTAFRNRHESGLLKMAVIGMGKQVGAELCHRQGWGFMAERIEALGAAVLQKAPVLFGLGLLENAYDETCRVAALTPEEILTREPALLAEARTHMPAIRFPRFDVLVVDRIGKNISGDGMDPNVTGTHFTPYATGGPVSEQVVILDLTDESHGCAIGIGAGSVTTRRLVDKIDYAKTYPNCLTSKVLDVCRIPLTAPCDRSAIAAAIYACALADRDNLRMVRIRDSLHVDEIFVSEALLDEARCQPGLEILEEPADMVFDARGNLF